MAAGTEIARLARAVDGFVAGIEQDLRSRPTLSPAERRALREEIERCSRLLDELRSRLGS